MASHVEVQPAGATLDAPRASIALSMPLAWQLRGLVLATERARDAVTRSRSNTRDVCIAIAETGNWLYSITDAKPALKGILEVAALLYARHRMQHQRAAPVHWDSASSAWVWSSAESIPPDLNGRGERFGRAYKQRAEGRPVVRTLERVVEAVGAVA